MSSGLAVTSFVFDCPRLVVSSSLKRRLAEALKITANRYTLEDSAENTQGVTLLFTHCIGSHKEQWEPTISHLFRRQAKHQCPADRIREAWSFDWQSHGDAGVLNREAIRSISDDDDDCISVYEWASAIAAFLRSPYMKAHRIVGLGHSAGAAAILISTKEFAINDSPYLSVVLIEPTMASKEVFYSRYEEHKAAVDFAVNTTSVRRDRWNSKEDAFAYFMKRVPWKNWDPRIVRLLVEHGLQTTARGVVQLKCDKRQEALSYADTEPHFEGANLVSRLCRSLPIHLVFGARDDPVFVLKPDFIKHSLCDTSQGRFVASIRRVNHAGHMVVQEQPDRLADSICGILDGLPTCHSIRSRL